MTIEERIAIAHKKRQPIRIELYLGKVICYVPAVQPFFAVLFSNEQHATVEDARRWVDKFKEQDDLLK